MKKYILFGLVGGILLFLWQFLSHAALDLHGDFHEYTEKQDTITAFLESIDLKEGSYMMPMYPPNMSHEEIEKFMDQKIGKPWIIMQYKKNWDMDMVMPMVRGFIIDIIAAMMLLYIFTQIKEFSTVKAIIISVFIGLIGFLSISYLNFIWYQTPDIWASLIDGIAPWILLGWIGKKFV
jgi:hypothetical protein